MNTSTENSMRRRCFISAPIGVDLTVLRRVLKDRGVEVLVPQDMAAGSDWASEIQAQISQASLVIGVLSGKDSSPWVLFELGQAAALGRQILLITSPSAEPIPFSLHQMIVLRIDPDNEDAIGFALDQVLSAPDRKKDIPVTQRRPLVGLGPKVDVLLAALERSLANGEWRAIEKVVSDALRESGTDIVVTSPTREKGADFAVWSDLQESLVGNPLLVEVKARIRRREDAVRVTEQIAAHVSAASARWGLLLYGEGPDPESEWWAHTPPNVLVLPLRSFLADLRTHAFPEVVRDLRNRRVHGSIA